jgi:hypothetical protein
LRSSSRDNIPPKIETNEEDLTSQDEDLTEEEERALAEHAAKMREKGEDSVVIDRAMRMARDVLRRQRQGHDRFPMRHHGDPWADRGTDATGNFGMGVDPPKGLDSSFGSSSRREINEIRRRMRKIGPEEDVRLKGSGAHLMLHPRLLRARGSPAVIQTESA